MHAHVRAHAHKQCHCILLFLGGTGCIFKLMQTDKKTSLLEQSSNGHGINASFLCIVFKNFFPDIVLNP